jgi:hypothetical protein
MEQMRTILDTLHCEDCWLGVETKYRLLSGQATNYLEANYCSLRNLFNVYEKLKEKFSLAVIDYASLDPIAAIGFYVEVETTAIKVYLQAKARQWLVTDFDFVKYNPATGKFMFGEEEVQPLISKKELYFRST